MSNQNRPHRSKESSDATLSSMLRSSLKGAAIGLALSAILAFVICAAIIGLDDPDSLVFPLSLAALYVSAFVAGTMATRINRGGSLVCGLLSGGIFMLSYIFVSLFFPSELSAKYGFLASLLFHALIIVFSVLGGYAATAKRTTQKHPKRALARRRSH